MTIILSDPIGDNTVEDKPEIKCTECGWEGYVSDLERSANGSDVCPECGSVDTFEDYEDLVNIGE